jgi:hypothetical protein
MKLARGVVGDHFSEMKLARGVIAIGAGEATQFYCMGVLSDRWPSTRERFFAHVARLHRHVNAIFHILGTGNTALGRLVPQDRPFTPLAVCDELPPWTIFRERLSAHR